MQLRTEQLILVSGMADYQFQPDMADPVAQLRLAMDKLDGKRCVKILQFRDVTCMHS